MEMNKYQLLLEKQRDYFRTGATLPVEFRKKALQTLLMSIKKRENEILKAVKTDLGKSSFEAYTNEIGIIYLEIKHLMKNIAKWAKPKKTKVEMFLMPASGTIYNEPYGTSLIIAPWNYPFQLVIAPLIAAIAAGNTAIVKPSEVSPATAKIVTTILEESFSDNFVAVVNGGVDETTALLSLPVDKIFFTGSVPVGKIVMAAAAKNLTPVTLELGGKSPVIVDKSADLKLAARKIVWGKFNNAGQTCVAPDYILVDKSIESDFIKKLQEVIREFYGENPEESNDFGRIINERHVARLEKLIDSKKVVFGGKVNVNKKYIAPTIMTDVTLDDIVMQDEIFGPILPVLAFEKIEDAISIIRSFSKPLALYLFTKDKNVEKLIMERVSFGGGGINTTILHVASSHLPFGGVGQSGTGSYHGKAGFDDFSHKKSVLKQPVFFDPGITYPGKQISLKLIKMIMG